jgi:hypothetical protein
MLDPKEFRQPRRKALHVRTPLAQIRNEHSMYDFDLAVEWLVQA